MLRKLSTSAFHSKLSIEMVNGQHTSYHKHSQILKIVQYQWIHLYQYIYISIWSNGKHSRRQQQQKKTKKLKYGAKQK